ncbi:DUF803-domain-containing protein [Gymnopus androsaceus JB14]|uniref:DUF803-domain-containing protein n=1 Tax=Gymnopus androsaceus JB14 TaxID=1447944 RepID=A0A6A4HRB3_9AGAR|nr:DUF803-domain-containing protein [Gymnopus androsaceus JB14]
MSSSSSAAASATSSAAAATSSAAAGTISTSSNLKVFLDSSYEKIVGIILAIASGCLIGSSFVFKKKGLLRAQAGHAAGEGVAYLKSPLWWLGMSMMIMGELCNFAAYAFVEAIVVTPLGALSVVICAILSSIFLKEKLTFFGWLGCGLCIVGSVIIALNGPNENSVGQIKEFQKLFLAPGFISYASVLIAISLTIIFYFAPRYGKKSMLWYIFVCSMIGGISVSVTTGLGAAIVTTGAGRESGFIAITLGKSTLTEVYYLNVALALFNTAMVTPTYYVIFTFFSILTTIVLFQGLSASASSIITLVMGFVLIRKTLPNSTVVQPSFYKPLGNITAGLDEKDVLAVEDPGMDTLRGSFGTVGTRDHPGAMAPYDPPRGQFLSPRGTADTEQFAGLQRHQLYDAPVPLGSPRDDVSSIHSADRTSEMLNKRTTIKFDTKDVVHQYHPTGTTGAKRDDPGAIHGHRIPPPPSPNSIMSGLPSPGSYPPSLSMTAVATAATGAGASSSRDVDLLSESPTDTDLSASALSQILSLPPLPARSPGQEGLPYSASPTEFVPRAKPGRKDSREIFHDTPSTATLHSFASVTDSARSEDNSDSGWSRGRTAKKYPKGDKDADREESVSLWHREGGNEDEEEDASRLAGIRLVTSPKGGSSRF